MGIQFEKFHGNGNDFAFFEKEFLSPFASLSSLREFVINLCNRQMGVGADGVVFYDILQNQLLIINSDGSLAATCGNALRCYGLKLLQDKLWDGISLVQIKRLVPAHLSELNEFDPTEGFARNKNEVFATLLRGYLKSKTICVAMGNETSCEILSLPENSVPFSNLSVVFVQLANPHLVFVSPEFSSFTQEQYTQFGKWAQGELLNTWGSRIPLSNISMISLQAKSHDSPSPALPWNLVVYERGAGLTLCCGSGAVASRIALEKLGFVPTELEKISFQLLGGVVDISTEYIVGQEYEPCQQQRALNGPAELVYKGNMEWI